MERKRLRQMARKSMLHETRENDREIVRQTREIAENLAGWIFVYLSVGQEVGTWDMIRAWLAEGRRVCVPRVIGPGEMQAVEITDVTHLKSGFLGIPEPESGRTIDPENIGICIVPCLMCSRNCGRLGQGGGYYDRFLAKTDACRIGLCREARMGEVPMEAHDQYLDFVVTERRIYRGERNGIPGIGTKLPGNHVSGSSEGSGDSNGNRHCFFSRDGGDGGRHGVTPPDPRSV